MKRTSYIYISQLTAVSLAMTASHDKYSGRGTNVCAPNLNGQLTPLMLGSKATVDRL